MLREDIVREVLARLVRAERVKAIAAHDWRRKRNGGASREIDRPAKSRPRGSRRLQPTMADGSLKCLDVKVELARQPSERQQLFVVLATLNGRSNTRPHAPGRSARSEITTAFFTRLPAFTTCAK